MDNRTNGRFDLKKLFCCLVIASLFTSFLFAGFAPYYYQSDTVIRDIAPAVSTMINESLFCPLISQSDINTYAAPLQHISTLQFSNTNQKYLIIEDFHGYGLFSTLEFKATLLTLAMALNRKYLVYKKWHRKWHWLKHHNGNGLKVCQGRRGEHCVFKPVSDLRQSEIRAILAAHPNHSHSIDVLCSAEAKAKASIQNWRELSDHLTVIYVSWQTMYDRFRDFKFENGKIERTQSCPIFTKHNTAISDWLRNEKQWSGVDYHSLLAFSFSYLLRLQNNIRQSVHSQIKHILFDKNDWRSVAQTLSLPIRGSDKCVMRDEGYKCVSMPFFAQIIHEILNTTRDLYSHIIITSEDTAMIHATKSSLDLPNLHKIYNDFDTDLKNTGDSELMEMGAANDTVLLAALLQMLTSLKLQMNAKYYIISRQSNWLHGIWVMSSKMDCQIHAYQTRFTHTVKKCVNFQSYPETGTEIEWNVSQCYRHNENMLIFQRRKNMSAC